MTRLDGSITRGGSPRSRTLVAEPVDRELSIPSWNFSLRALLLWIVVWAILLRWPIPLGLLVVPASIYLATRWCAAVFDDPARSAVTGIATLALIFGLIFATTWLAISMQLADDARTRIVGSAALGIAGIGIGGATGILTFAARMRLPKLLILSLVATSVVLALFVPLIILGSLIEN